MDTELLRQLSGWLARTDIDQLELSGPGTQLCLRRIGQQVQVLSDGAVPQGPQPHSVAVADSPGVFLHGHPMAAEPLAPAGSTVRAGQPIGLLRIGALLLPVLAPLDGVVAAIHVRDGAIVGWGDALADIQPIDTQD